MLQVLPGIILIWTNIFRITEKHVLEFLNGVGPKLQEELIVNGKNNKHTSYNAGKIIALLPQMNLPRPLIW